MPDPIGFVLKGYPRLSEAFIAQEIRALEARGLTIEIFSMRGAREDAVQPAVGAIRAPVRYLPHLPDLGAGALAELLPANLAALRRFPAAYAAALAHALRACLRRRSRAPLERLLEAGWLVARHGLGASSPVRHLHAHFIHSPAELAFYAARVAGLSFSVTAHAKDIYTTPAAELSERIAASRFVLTCTAYNRDRLAAMAGEARRKVHLAYHGVDLNAFQPGAGAGDARRLVSVGRLVPKKGFAGILAALAMLRDQGEDFRWELFGAGPLEDALRAQAEALGLGARVRFRGAAAHPRIIARLSRGGVFLCGSVEAEDGDRDGIPNTVLEAMAMGLPVVATAVSGIPEAVRDGVDGLLAPPRDPRAFAAAVRRLWREPGLAERLSLAARARVESLFDADACVAACARHFEALAPRVRETVG